MALSRQNQSTVDVVGPRTNTAKYTAPEQSRRERSLQLDDVPSALGDAIRFRYGHLSTAAAFDWD
jgi:hypothetical protein